MAQRSILDCFTQQLAKATRPRVEPSSPLPAEPLHHPTKVQRVAQSCAVIDEPIVPTETVQAELSIYAELYGPRSREASMLLIPRNKRDKPPGFDRTGLPKRWNNIETYRLMVVYLTGIGARLDDGDDWNNWHATATPKIWCTFCNTFTANTALTNLQRGQGMACWCSGCMHLDDQQYYGCMINEPMCRMMNCYMCFHDERNVLKPTLEKFMAAAKHDRSGAMLLECGKCRTTSGTSTLSNLQRNHGITCWCSGSMLYTDKQYYECMIRDDMCRMKGDNGCYMCFHDERQVIKPTLDAYMVAARVGKSGKMLLKCGRCRTTSLTWISTIQTNDGIACFCSRKMKITDPQYFHSIMDPDLCRRENVYMCFHDDRQVIKPTIEVYMVAARKGKDSHLVLECGKCHMKCSTRLGGIQQNYGLGCGCVNKTEGILMAALKEYADDKIVHVIDCSPGQYQPACLTGTKMRFDIGLMISANDGHAYVAVECDGLQHLTYSPHFHKDNLDGHIQQAQVDGKKISLAYDMWHVRFHQPGMLGDKYQWRTFMENAIALVTRGGEPRVVLPEVYRPEYTRWAGHANIHMDAIVWM